MNLCIALPMWRPHGRLRAVMHCFALRALPLRGFDTSGIQHPLHSFNVGAISVSFLPENLGKAKAAEQPVRGAHHHA